MPRWLALAVKGAAAFHNEAGYIPEGDPRVGEEGIGRGHEGPFDQKGHWAIARAFKWGLS